jgi:antitoxin Xre/MbcA/ParS-like protein
MPRLRPTPGMQGITSFDALSGHAPAGIRTFFRIADRWDLTAEQQRRLLGEPPRSTFYKWRGGDYGGVRADTLERLSHLFGVYGALHGLFLDKRQADEWVRWPNDAFAGKSALDHMLGGRVADLYDVRRYAEAAAEGLT